MVRTHEWREPSDGIGEMEVLREGAGGGLSLRVEPDEEDVAAPAPARRRSRQPVALRSPHRTQPTSICTLRVASRIVDVQLLVAHRGTASAEDASGRRRRAMNRKELEMSTTEYRIEREIVIDAPTRWVWRTITEPDRSPWVRRQGGARGQAGARGYLGSANRAAHGHRRDRGSPTRFSFRWNHPAARSRGGKTLSVEFILVGEGEQTRLRVVETGLNPLPWPRSTSSGMPTSTTGLGRVPGPPRRLPPSAPRTGRG